MLEEKRKICIGTYTTYIRMFNNIRPARSIALARVYTIHARTLGSGGGSRQGLAGGSHTGRGRGTHIVRV